MQICKYGNIRIYLQKNINIKNVKECVKKVKIYMNYEVTFTRNVNKETNKQNKEIRYKIGKYTEMCIKINKNI